VPMTGPSDRLYGNVIVLSTKRLMERPLSREVDPREPDAP
jgi:hypothetical protein